MGTILKVKETPLLMSPDLAQKTFLGLKTVTRRLIKIGGVQPEHDPVSPILGGPALEFKDPKRPGISRCLAGEYLYELCPYGGPGDLLWVRETHYRWTGCGAAPLHFIRDPAGESYEERAYIGDPTADALYSQAAACVLVPSIHMPRWACRTWLKIKSVRAERVQEITEADIRAEGFPHQEDADNLNEFLAKVGGELTGSRGLISFSFRWQKRYPGSWDRNEWVWRIEFEKTEGK